TVSIRKNRRMIILYPHAHLFLQACSFRPVILRCGVERASTGEQRRPAPCTIHDARSALLRVTEVVFRLHRASASPQLTATAAVVRVGLPSFLPSARLRTTM